ncbi:Cys-tRNA(Pro) deacylase [Billgrantia desiderata]|uniref:Cys-tRNA(Pro)/Cys-tRNA(Cys) deacylase n=1 Tax=Billgrantia desiderata TaxID=52021 RepID=A0ABS9B5C1_9GAMM|nr:Cys-tRNA(Pro) deacylase [Halomonas desiderata]MCE8010981.1 Cys-tRNA(Pro) deacylase [Halomonas desiderata]MCE8030322.1 Cys-tRNA(Pro) deacylase [Halomonas desiderata]MCE8042827.1 Cys-tRNA(Pro) deacylase [Halomonas desiderata]MCE8047402.1 Cys-tRNA(Pro) deacylase [Halomonas desiderata]NIC37173.1 Cys-tRNA(Pro) deacylase [Halomonas desiderata]
MTPAIKALERDGVPFELLSYEHDPRAPAYGEEAANALGLDPRSVFKTLIARLDDGRLAVGIVPVTGQLDLKALAKAADARRASMAEAAEAERATGYVLGGISPLGQKKRLATFLDASAKDLDRLHVSGGRRGLEIALAPADLIRLCQARLAPLARP